MNSERRALVRYFAGMVESREEIVELERRLLHSPDAERDFVLESTIDRWLREQNEILSGSSSSLVPRVRQMGAVQRRRWLPRGSSWLLGVSALLAAVWLISVFTSEVTQDRVAILAVEDLQWNEDQGDSWPSTTLEQQAWLSISSGLMHVRLANGAEMVIEGPARFNIINDLNVHLPLGRVAVRCTTKQTHGFTVRVPGGHVVDLGTEFGVEVNEEGEARLHVFEGEVQVLPENMSAVRPSPFATRVARECEAYRIGRDGRIEILDDEVPSFTRPGDRRLGESVR